MQFNKMKLYCFITVILLSFTDVRGQFSNEQDFHDAYKQAMDNFSDVDSLPANKVLYYNFNFSEQDIDSISRYKNLRFLVGISESVGLEKLCGFKKLFFLDMNTKSILPICLQELDSLYSLIVINSQYEELPTVIGKLKNLRILNISLPRLKKNQEEGLIELRELDSLLSLEVYLPRIKAFPELICELTSLRFLSLGYNRLFSLPQELGRLKKILYLELPVNLDSREDIEVLCQLTSLRELWIYTDKKIRTIPQNISCLSFLKKLFIISKKELSEKYRKDIRNLLPKVEVRFEPK